jgi:hypothetical protein
MIVFNINPLLPNFNEAGLDFDSKIMDFYEKSQIFLKKYPELGTAIEYDLDNCGLQKKKVRNAEKTNEEYSNIANNEILFDPTEYNTPDAELILKTGRPRMTVDMVLFFLVLRGHWGSISNQSVAERIADSRSIHSILLYHGHKLPGINTIRENLNKISGATLQLIIECQADHILVLGLDDFNEVYIDSTHVSANTAFPTDIDILYKLLKRVILSMQKLEEFNLPIALASWILTRIEKMEKHLKYINMNARKGIKGKVKEAFRSFLNLAGKEIAGIDIEIVRLTPYWEVIKLDPVKRMALDFLWDKIDQDLWDALYVMEYAWLRIEKKIKTPTREKILSISDRSAAYIAKGQREPVIGYRPQVARSRNGFICCCLTPVGNAADSDMLVPTVKHVVKTTKRVPELVSTDDGYSSEEGVKFLESELGILKVSIGGAKGKKLLGDDLWVHPDYVKARINRSAAESGIFTLKHNHGFGQVLRRGIDAVNAELMEKVIAYNFTHMARIEGRKRKELEETELRERIPGKVA